MQLIFSWFLSHLEEFQIQTESHLVGNIHVRNFLPKHFLVSLKKELKKDVLFSAQNGNPP